jgi:hypothetical protein
LFGYDQSRNMRAATRTTSIPLPVNLDNDLILLNLRE